MITVTRNKVKGVPVTLCDICCTPNIAERYIVSKLIELEKLPSKNVLHSYGKSRIVFLCDKEECMEFFKLLVA